MDYLDKFKPNNITWIQFEFKIASSKTKRMLKKAGLKTKWKIAGFSELKFKTDKNHCTL